MKSNSMKIMLMVSLSLSALFSTAQEKKSWQVDNIHSSIRFSVAHLVISEVEGSFKVYDGGISSTKDDFSDAKVGFTIDVASINTDNSMRDEHLKSNDFFCADKFPKMTFKSTSFKKKSGNQYQLIGDLTIRDITKKVVFDVKYGGTAKDAYGNTKAGFRVSGKINRMDYGLKWNVLTEAGGATVGSEVSLTGNLEFVLAK